MPWVKGHCSPLMYCMLFCVAPVQGIVGSPGLPGLIGTDGSKVRDFYIKDGINVLPYISLIQ